MKKETDREAELEKRQAQSSSTHAKKDGRLLSVQ